VLLLAANAGLNINAALEGGQPFMSPTVFGIVALVIGQATAIRAGQFAWRRRLRGRALLAFFALGCAEFYGLYTGGERLLIARERQVQSIAKINQEFDITERRVTLAEDAYRKADEAATAETRRGGCGRACRDLRATANHAQEELEAARSALAETPPKSRSCRTRKARGQNRLRRGTRSEQVADFCEDFRAKHGRSPSFTEVRLGTQLAKLPSVQLWGS
jgi:hypothetical protein